MVCVRVGRCEPGTARIAKKMITAAMTVTAIAKMYCPRGRRGRLASVMVRPCYLAAWSQAPSGRAGRSSRVG